MSAPPNENPAASSQEAHRAEGLDHYSNPNLAEPAPPSQAELKFPAQAKWRSRNPQKLWAQRALRAALKMGLIQPKPCQRCGAEPAEAHHPSYDRPAYVVWLCRRCHRGEHSRQKSGAV
jgi:hypothetical protein